MAQSDSNPRRRTLPWVLAAIVTGSAAAALPHAVATRRTAPQQEAMSIGPQLGMPGAPPTSADGLRQRIDDMERRLRADAHDVGASVLLADALLRQARATSDGRPAGRAAVVLEAALKDAPAQYDALRMLGAIYLSQHRFGEALAVARRARSLRPADAWNYGVMGDALLELGDYDQAFDAFDTMAAMRPSAAAYARASYGRELRGDLNGALEAMQMARQATTGEDPEAQAWYGAQLGELFLKMGKLDLANREYRRAAFAYPNYPPAMIGQGKVQAARGDREGALAIYLDQVKRTPTLDLAARIGDLYAAGGDRSQAERYFQLGEDVAGPAPAQTEANLALFLAEHDRKLPDAVRIAEKVSAVRHDIFTDDALSWAYYKVGRLDDALAASQRALRTGAEDAHIAAHALQIREACALSTPAASVPPPS